MAMLHINNHSYKMSYISEERIKNARERVSKTSFVHYIKAMASPYWISEKIPAEDRQFVEEAIEACTRSELPHHACLVEASLSEVYLFALSSSGKRSFSQFSVYGSNEIWSIQHDEWEGFPTPFNDKNYKPGFFLVFIPDTQAYQVTS